MALWAFQKNIECGDSSDCSHSLVLNVGRVIMASKLTDKVLKTLSQLYCVLRVVTSPVFVSGIFNSTLQLNRTKKAGMIPNILNLIYCDIRSCTGQLRNIYLTCQVTSVILFS